ncbi:MAG TPA: DUF6653 family protein [Mycobacteriales bacterium]|jgi:hypothetical protein|nr:DUF6653 family protein [Mycobacteriales bacterium]
MTTTAPTPVAPRSKATFQSRVAKLFGLEGDKWMRHANPWSVGTRFAVLPLLAVSVWSRDWIGWWSLIPIALSVVFLVTNPLLFPPPRSTRNWASRGVFGERVYANRTEVEIPPQYRSPVPVVANVISAVGMSTLAYGLVVLNPLAVVAGLVIQQTAKSWYIDRMVLLYEDMKTRDPEYARWEH